MHILSANRYYNRYFIFIFFCIQYLQLVIVAVRMILHIKLKDGNGNATSRACLDVPDALTVCWVFFWIAWAGKSTSEPHEFPTTTCRGQQWGTSTFSLTVFNQGSRLKFTTEILLYKQEITKNSMAHFCASYITTLYFVRVALHFVTLFNVSSCKVCLFKCGQGFWSGQIVALQCPDRKNISHQAYQRKYETVLTITRKAVATRLKCIH